MKNLTLTFAIVFACFLGSNNSWAGGNLDARAATVTRSMSTQLGLNEMEYIKLRNLNLEHMTKAAEVNRMFSNDPAFLEVKINELKLAYEKELGSILNSKQMESYVAYKENKQNYTVFTAEGL